MFVMYFYTSFIRCFSRDWRVMDYGICDLMDLLTEIPDTTITITHQDTDTVISVPKRGQFETSYWKELSKFRTPTVWIVLSGIFRFYFFLIRFSWFPLIFLQSVLLRKWSAPSSLGRRWWTSFVTSLTAGWPSVSSSPPTTITSAVSASSATTASPSSWSSSRQSPAYWWWVRKTFLFLQYNSLWVLQSCSNPWLWGIKV